MIGSKNSQNSEQFMTRSGNHSTKPSAKGYDLLGGGEDPNSTLTPEERRDSLVRRLAYLQGLRVDGHKTKSVGLEIQQVQEEIRKLRPAIKSTNAGEIPSLFMDAARELLSKREFDMLLSEANRRQRGGVTIEAIRRGK